jgi:hypothetical protein
MTFGGAIVALAGLYLAALLTLVVFQRWLLYLPKPFEVSPRAAASVRLGFCGSTPPTAKPCPPGTFRRRRRGR